MSAIFIKDLIVEGHHGANPGEKDTAQRFGVSVELTFDMAAAARSDEVDDTLNWSQVRDTIVETVHDTSFNLVERLAKEIADRLMQDMRITKLQLNIDKLDAFVSGVPGVNYERTR